MKSDKSNIIHLIPESRNPATTIADIATQRAVIPSSMSIRTLFDHLKHHPELLALGVHDEWNHVVGIIVVSDFFVLFSRPYGMEILMKRTVEEIMTPPKTFRWNRNIFSIAETLDDSLKSRKEDFYVLTKEDNQFAGIFSTWDLLIYLSGITQRDLLAARQLQQRIVHQNKTCIYPEYQIHCGSRMAKEVGGDFYYHNQYDNDHALIAVCDVAGKGVSASLVTTLLWGVFQQYDYTRGTAELIKDINIMLLEAFQGEKFVTAWVIDFNYKTGQGRIYDMGHTHFLLFRNNRFYTMNSNAGNPPVGLMPHLKPAPIPINLDSEDQLYIYTDGLIEQKNEEGDDYRPKRLKQLIANRKGMQKSRIKSDILNDFYRFRGNHPQHDDVTLLMLHFSGCSGRSDSSAKENTESVMTKSVIPEVR